MGSLLEELARREAAARERVETVRNQIERLRERLAAEEGALSRLMIARETVEEILGETAQLAERQPSAGASDDGAGGLGSGGVTGSPIGVLTVPPWRPGMDGSVLPQAYRDVLKVLCDAGRPLRAGHLAAALGLGEGAGAVEGLRSKLKRLVARGWLSEDTPGMFEVIEQVIGQITEQAAGRQDPGSNG